MDWNCISSFIISTVILLVFLFIEKKRDLTPWDYKEVLFFLIILSAFLGITGPFLRTIFGKLPFRYFLIPVVLTVLFVFFILYNNDEGKFRNKKSFYLFINNRKDIYWGLGIGICFVSYRLLKLIINKISSLDALIITFNFSIPFLLYILYLSIMEEVFFRAVLIKSLEERVSTKSAVIVSAIVFAIYHCPSPYIINHILYGIIFGYVFIRRKNIITTIIIHVMINLSFFISF